MAPGNDREPQIAKVELDRKLDNPKSTLAERCGAVAGYAILLQGKSSASVCNSAFLKLADIFEKTPDNMLRFAVVNVMGRCHAQLMRVFNTDILVHKVHTVLEKSIDPIARSLALRALACMAELLIHNQRIHSDVRNALRSPNEIEQTACILCVQRLCQLSQAFASGAISLIGGLVIALETPLQQRLQLIPVLQHMDRDPRTVLQSRQI
jgi:integrator complex subunit 7